MATEESEPVLDAQAVEQTSEQSDQPNEIEASVAETRNDDETEQAQPNNDETDDDTQQAETRNGDETEQAEPNDDEIDDTQQTETSDVRRSNVKRVSIDVSNEEESKNETRRGSGASAKSRHSTSFTELENLMKEENEENDLSSLLEELGESKAEEAEQVPDEQSIKKKKKKRKPKGTAIKTSQVTTGTIGSGGTTATTGTEGSGLSSFPIGEPKSLISGDFQPIGSSRRSTLTKTLDEGIVTEEEEEEEEEEEVEEESERGMTDEEKETYFRLYDVLEKELEEEKAKNAYYQKQLRQYYQKRRMFHVFVNEGKLHAEMQKKYEKQLDEFNILAETFSKEQLKMQTELHDLKEKSAQKETETKSCFEKLQREEFELGKEITSSEAEKGEAKLIERYLKRQRIQLSHIIKIRLDYIKLHNRYAETQEALNNLDNLGPELRLVDYEQLKLDNFTLLDKLDEKELELTKVRQKCQNAVQILAHLREKISAMDVDIVQLNERLEAASGEYEDAREQLNQLKQEKDWFRSAITCMKEKSGLLTKPKLLMDMTNTIGEIDTLSKQLNNAKNEFSHTVYMLDNIKKNMSSEDKIHTIRSIMDGSYVPLPKISDNRSNTTASTT